MRKPRDVGGNVPTTAKADGLAIAKVIPRPHVVWQRSDHGESGWYGDSEGHSKAARRGWDEGHRSQRRDDDDERQGGSAGETTNIEAVRGKMTIVVTKAG